MPNPAVTHLMTTDALCDQLLRTQKALQEATALAEQETERANAAEERIRELEAAQNGSGAPEDVPVTEIPTA